MRGVILSLAVALCAVEGAAEPSHARDRVTEVRDAVLALAQKQPKLLGLGPEEALDRIVVISLARGFTVRAGRTYRGVPVIDERVAVRLDDDHDLVRVRTDFHPLHLESEVALSAGEAAARALSAVHGGAKALPAQGVDLPVNLVVVASLPAWAYAVHVPGLLPMHRRNVLVHAGTGEVLQVRSPVRRAATSAAVYDTHPEPEAQLAEPPLLVSLERLRDDPPRVTAGAYVDSKSCVTDTKRSRILTCLDIANGRGCDFMPELKSLAVPFCGEDHIATNQGRDGFLYPPVDDLADYQTGAVFHDPFAEVHAYYHADRVAEWFRALGHPVETQEPIPVLVNISIPSMDLISCVSEQWASLPESRTSDDARTALEACADLPNPQMPFDNAMLLGDELEAIAGIRGGLYFGQGSAADFAYDGDVIYHEYAHAVHVQLGGIGEGQPFDEYGTDSSSGALAEAFADYFAGALAGHGEMGRYVGVRIGMDSALRTMEHGLVCPHYVEGEAHQDAAGLSGALWAIRAQYPQTEDDPTTGMQVRVLDRVVYEALTMLTSEATVADVVAEVVQGVRAEETLEDPDAARAACVFEARRLGDCVRARPLCSDDTGVARMFLAGRGSGQAMAMLGGTSFSPYAPGPVQLVIDVPEGEHTAEVQAEIMQSAFSLEDISDMPDIFGSGNGEPPPIDLRVRLRVDGPVEFQYQAGFGVTGVSTVQDDGEVALVATDRPGGLLISGTLELPPTARRVYLAFANYSQQPLVLQRIRLTSAGFVCPPMEDASDVPCPEGAAAEKPVDGTPAPEAGGCGCQGAPATGIAVLTVLGLVGRRRRKLGR